ncbi:MAG: helix-turn-helix domain-containing protein [Victivallales bacterium]|nr:helix-turn-helix domain-containing protein [Victivallales bacterium]
MSTEQVSLTTKIKEDFIVALENDDESAFPPKVFATAYAKQLCKLYKVDPTLILEALETDMATRGNKHKVPDEILQDIDNGKQRNLREEERLKRIFKTALISLAAIVLLVLIVNFALNGGNSNNESDSSPTADVFTTPSNASESPGTEQTDPIKPEELEVFIINQPTFTMTKLKVPENDE